MATPAVGCPDAPAAGIATYYACDCGADSDKDCVAGKDSNDGKSPATAWQSFEKARSTFASLKAGDRIEFCQGGGFTVGSANTWVNSNCRANNRCVVASYKAPWASGDEGRPVIHPASGQNAIDFSDPNNPDHEEGYVFAGLELKGSGTNWGFLFYNDIDDVLVCDMYVHNFDIGVNMAGANPSTAGADTHNDRVVLRNSIFNDNGGQGWLGCDNGLSIENSHFENNGFGEAVFNHNIYLSPADGGAKNVQVKGNELYRSTVMSGQCKATSLVVHGVIDGLLIEGNYVHEDLGGVGLGCWGIAIVPGYATAESFKNVTIRGNTVTNLGNMSIGVASCQSCLIENNVVINQQKVNVDAISAPAGDEGSEDAKDNQITIRNNSILIDVGRGIGLGQEGTGNVVVNNAIYSAGGGNGGVACFNLDQPAASYTEVDYNVCFLNGKGEWALGKGALSAWTSKTGFDQHSMLTDPSFTAMVAPMNLTPTASSPLVNKGDAKNSPSIDTSNKTRDAMPDVGAYER